MDYPYNTDFTNYALEIEVIFQNDDEFDNDYHIRTVDTVYDHYKALLVIIPVDHSKGTFKDFTHTEYIYLYLISKRNFKYRFYNMNFPRLTGEYPTNNFSSSTKEIWGH